MPESLREGLTNHEPNHVSVGWRVPVIWRSEAVMCKLCSRILECLKGLAGRKKHQERCSRSWSGNQCCKLFKNVKKINHMQQRLTWEIYLKRREKGQRRWQGERMVPRNQSDRRERETEGKGDRTRW